MGLYKHVIRPVLFRGDAEAMHGASIGAARILGKVAPLRGIVEAALRVRDARLRTEVCGLSFENPIGLAAGYDKSGVAVDGLAALGFGHIEVGSVSVDPSAGNPRPRLFRLPMDEAVVVHYGLQNDGAEAVAERLRLRTTRVPVGVNIVKTNRGMGAPPEPSDAILDEYVRAVRILEPAADYLSLNLSCPNTENGRDFFCTGSLNTGRLLEALKDLGIRVPLFLKISPVGGVPALEETLAAADGAPFVSGFIFNLAPGMSAPLRTSERETSGMPGSVAGRPVEAQMNACIKELYRRMDRTRYRIIGAGGVFSAEDAYRKLRLGASLVQLLTGLVYEGPGVVKRINEGLAGLLARDGLGSVGEAVGAGER